MPTANSIRVQRFHERQKAGVMVVPFEIDEEAVEFLTRSGMLALDSIEDRKAIADALRVLLKLVMLEDNQ